MINLTILKQAGDFVRATWPQAKPACGIVLGSGWGLVAEAFTIKAEIPYEQIPGLGKTGVAGHAGRLVWGHLAGLETFIFQGRRHWYEGAGWTPVALPVYLLKMAGADRVLFTNAAGGINPVLKTGDLMIIRDHINFMGGNPLLGPHHPAFGPRFPDQGRVYDPILREGLIAAGQQAGVALESGVYLATSGPAYETPAEIKAFRALGADAVGMSTVPEAMLANGAGLKVAGISCITNLASGVGSAPLSHEEVAETAARVMPILRTVISNYWKQLAASSMAPRHDADWACT